MTSNTKNINQKIQSIFSEVPKTYETVNHLLTFGLDRIWRKRVVRHVSRLNPQRVLDVCSGTGETAVYLKQRSDAGVQVFALDFTLAMVQQAIQKKECRGIGFCLGDVKRLPFPDNTFDCVTLSFATRNLNMNRQKLIEGFSEIHRVLKEDGCFFNLETSQPPVGFIRVLFHFFVKMTVLPLGKWMSGSQKGYDYLSNTMRRFYDAEALAAILKEAGFKQVDFKRWFFGVVALHQSVKQSPI